MDRHVDKADYRVAMWSEECAPQPLTETKDHTGTHPKCRYEVFGFGRAEGRRSDLWYGIVVLRGPTYSMSSYEHDNENDCSPSKCSNMCI